MPYWPAPPPPAPKKSRVGLVLAIVAGVVVLALGGGAAVFFATRHGQPAATAQPAGSTVPAGSAPAVAAAPAGNGYAPPSDVCALADPAVLDAGTPGSGSMEKEDTRFTLTGCVWDLAASDVTNSVKLFVAVDGDAQARYQESERIWAGHTVPGFTSQPVTGLGTKAIAAHRLSSQNRRLESVLALYDQNLYLECRFSGGGTRPWDAAAVRDRMVSFARAALAKVPRR